MPYKNPDRAKENRQSRRVQNRDASKRWQSKCVQDGKCPRCGNPVAATTTRASADGEFFYRVVQECASCREKHHTALAKRYASRRSSGVCTSCTKPNDSVFALCQACRTKHQERKKILKEQRASSGLCVRCGAVNGERSACCSSCRAQFNKYIRGRAVSRVVDGRCQNCESPVAMDSVKYCERHLLMRAARANCGTSRLWKELGDLLDHQGRLCAYTGVPLYLGVNASVDHKTPRTRGGANGFENLQWVAWKVNKAKGNMTHDEFVSMCGSVVARTEIRKGDQ